MPIDDNLKQKDSKEKLSEIVGLGAAIGFVLISIMALGFVCYKYGPKLYEYIEEVLKSGVDGGYGF